jgi:shikimate 5-dehydrogenase
LPHKLDQIARAGCFINASPIGQGLVELPFWLTPFLNSFGRDALILDLVYARGGRTALCQLAKGTGFRRVEDGRQMLVEQARQAFKIWTGLTAAYSVGFDALEKAQTID